MKLFLQWIQPVSPTRRTRLGPQGKTDDTAEQHEFITSAESAATSCFALLLFDMHSLDLLPPSASRQRIGYSCQSHFL